MPRPARRLLAYVNEIILQPVSKRKQSLPLPDHPAGDIHVYHHHQWACLKGEVELEAFPHRGGEDQGDEHVCDCTTFDDEGGHFDLSDGLVVVFEDALAAGDGDVEPVGVVAVEGGEDAVSWAFKS